jgi:hypothetical protein
VITWERLPGAISAAARMTILIGDLIFMFASH